MGVLLFMRCGLFLCILIALSACGGGGSDSGTGSGGSSGDRTLQGGDTTTSDRSTLAFEHPAANLSGDEDARHTKGDGDFGSIFVTPPATFNAGLGPIFNNNSCDACHTKNGRGQPVLGTGPQGSQALVRLSLAGGAVDPVQGVAPVPGFGTQLQDHATFGLTPEATAQLRWEIERGVYGDGTAYELRKPVITINSVGGRSLPAGTQTSFRTAPPVFGVGLLEAIPDATLESLADPDDANGDGISGRPNRVFDLEQMKEVIGRFGRKASHSTLRQQAAAAYREDIGVTNPIFPDDDGSTEVTEETLSSVTFYTQTIAVPRAGDIASLPVTRGEQLFSEAQCSACHVQSLTTGDHPVAALRNQVIFPYTDLLLHDLGEGLADNRPDFIASGTEWRTAPLWGIGVTATILSSTANFLHDGRARTIEEAILWHGGEAARAKDAFRQMSAEDRAALVAFVKSL